MIYLKNKKIFNEINYYKYIISKLESEVLYSNNFEYFQEEEKLYKIFGDCDNFNNEIEMIIVSDTHNNLDYNKFKDFVSKHNDYDVCILLGNHDYDYLEKYNIKNLNGELVNIKGISILGIEGSFKYKDEMFPSFTQKESVLFLMNKPKVDILLSHDKRFDISNNNSHQGLFGITYYLYKNRIPYHIHGHIHNSYQKK